MVNFKQMAIEYKESEKATIKNIADLDKVSAIEEVVEKTFAENTDKEFKVMAIVRDEEGNMVYYRVPKSVISQIKIHLENNDSFDEFRVKKTGNTMNDTQYFVIPL